METSASNQIPLTANNKVFLKKDSSQFDMSQSQKGTRKSLKKRYKRIKVFLLDDDPFYLKGLELSLSSCLGSLAIKSFQSWEACLVHMPQKPAIVILDYYLNSKNVSALDGLDVLKHIKQFYPKTKVVMLSSQDSLNVAIDCINNGAYDYVSKSHSSFVRINNIIKNIAEDIDLVPNFYKKLQFVLLVIAFLVIISLLMRF